MVQQPEWNRLHKCFDISTEFYYAMLPDGMNQHPLIIDKNLS